MRGEHIRTQLSVESMLVAGGHALECETGFHNCRAKLGGLVVVCFGGTPFCERIERYNRLAFVLYVASYVKERRQGV